jgi:hypothetical protein
MYVRNDVLIDGKINKEFATVFVHEMYHEMSDQTFVYNSLGATENERSEKDEVLARKFTRYLGLGE